MSGDSGTKAPDPLPPFCRPGNSVSASRFSPDWPAPGHTLPPRQTGLSHGYANCRFRWFCPFSGSPADSKTPNARFCRSARRQPGKTGKRHLSAENGRRKAERNGSTRLCPALKSPFGSPLAGYAAGDGETDRRAAGKTRLFRLQAPIPASPPACPDTCLVASNGRQKTGRPTRPLLRSLAKTQAQCRKNRPARRKPHRRKRRALPHRTEKKPLVPNRLPRSGRTGKVRPDSR